MFKPIVEYQDIDYNYPLKIGKGCMVNKGKKYGHWLYTDDVIHIDEETGIFETATRVYMPVECIDQQAEEAYND